MPRLLQPPSLREASIRKIVSNFEDYMCAAKSSTLLEDSGQSEVFTPFQYLRDDMIQEIIDMLHKRNVLSPCHFKLLLHSNIKRLHLKGCIRGEDYSSVLSEDYSEDYSPVIKTLSSRCQNLTFLKIDPLYVRYMEELCTLFANIPHLTSLDISNTVVNAEVLKVISENCPNLLDFSTNLCRNLCDRDLLYFCNSPTRHTNLPKLRNLLLTGLEKKPSADIVVHLLNSQPSLRHLCIPGSIDRAFERMYGEEFQSMKKVPPEWIHNLLDIKIFGDSHWKLKRRGNSGGELKPILSQVDRLNLTFQCCPFLTKLTLIDVEDSEILYNVSNLKHLTKLIVRIPFGMITPLTHDSRIFSTHMESVLTEIGHNLISLECYGFVQVRLIAIGKLCPKLESLRLNKTEFKSEHGLMEDYVNNPFPCFKNLNVIKIHLLTDWTAYPQTSKFVDVEELSLLFQNASEITEIELSGTNNLTDKVISSSNKTHRFRHLKKCFVVGCSPISVESVWELLSVDNPLEELFVRRCENITENDMNLVKQEAKLRQLDVNVIII